ncbi:MAG: CCA tRNA nucleotidyltransferase [bacterium]|nr:CCA tRNA nucleotidyltransferase [bacterium]
MDYLESSLEVLKILNNNNFDAFIVGGFVRDYLLNIKSNDIDLTSSATPSEVSKLFKTIPTGIKYGTVLIDYNGFKFEHTTFRKDGLYNDSRHPEEIEFSKNILEDIKRRDFTINALLMDKDKNIIDYLDAKKDLDNKIIKTIGNPNDRFNEDALRMLRCISFVSKLGFDIEDGTYKSIYENKDLLRNVSIERIRIEFDKISNGCFRKKAWELFYKLKLNEIFPNMLELKTYDVSIRDILIYNLVETGEISDFWMLSKQEIRNLNKCVNLLKNGINNYNMFISGYTASIYALTYLKLDLKLWDNLKIKSLKDLNINGNDLVDVVSKNKRGDCLNHLAKLVIDGKVKNEKDELLEEAYRWNTSA